MVSEPTFRYPPLQVMEDCLYQCVGDLVHELQRKVEKFQRKMEVHEVQRKIDKSFGRFESTLTEIKSEFQREQQQTMLASHSVQEPHAPHHHHNVKTQPLYSQIWRPIKPSSPSHRSIHPSLQKALDAAFQMRRQPPC